MTCLDPPPRHALVADHLLMPLLADRPQRQMIIQQPAQQLPSVAVQTPLKLAVREPGSVRPIQKHKRDSNCSRLEPNPAGTGESPGERPLPPPPRAAPSLPHCPPGRTSPAEA
jgi:hypothetical protein